MAESKRGGVGEIRGLEFALKVVDVSPGVGQLCLGSLGGFPHDDDSIAADTRKLDTKVSEAKEEAAVFHAVALHLLDDTCTPHERTVGYHHGIVFRCQFGIVLAHYLDVIGVGGALLDANLVAINFLVRNLGMVYHVIEFCCLAIKREEVGIACHLLTLIERIYNELIYPPELTAFVAFGASFLRK